ncbi:P-type conjugative transfer protein TrbL [Phenylobacterium sp.]|uniref:P-type conjugative transfer protein TrbL n=1 Tax=Phenylobacterium sp. TaxID=1871053 RepID=UPI0035AE7B8A
MNPGVADRFLDVFARYIDSGFGLVGGEVAFLASTLVAIDMTLAALFWAWSPGEEILARLVKKTLFVGAFAFILSNFNMLAQVVFESFAGLGLKAGGGGMSAGEFLAPGRLGQAGIDAGRPILEAAQELSGFPAVFDNLPQIVVLLLAWLVVVVAFFVLAVQLFVTLIEFKLTTLAGFILVPFGLFGRTAFLAERVLGNVMASGVKVLVLAVIVAIGSSLFDEFVHDFDGLTPNLEEVLSLALAALCLLGLGVFGPSAASGLVGGGPQLGAGAAVGTGLAAGGLAAGGLMGGRALAGAASAGLRGALDTVRRRPGGAAAAMQAGGPAGASPGETPGRAPEAPAWARRLQQRQAAGQALSTAAHAVRAGDQPGGGTSVSLKEDGS